MPTIRGIRFHEDSVNRSPIVRYSSENAAVIRKLYLSHDRAKPDPLSEAALALCGGARIDTETFGGVTRAWVTRQTPDFYPATPTFENPTGTPFLFVEGVPVGEPCSKPSGVDDQGRTEYDWYRLTCNYETRGYNVKEDGDVLATGTGPAVGVSPLAADVFDHVARPDEGDCLARGWKNSRWILKQVDRAARTVSLKQGVVQWQLVEGRGPAKEAINEGLPYSQARLSVNYTWVCVPEDAVPELAMQTALGRCNQFSFDKFPLGTLLLADAKARYYTSATGQRVADVAYHCIFLPNRDSLTGVFMGWNSWLRVVDGKVRCWPISGDGNTINPDDATATNKIVQHYDFSYLFRPPYPFLG